MESIDSKPILSSKDIILKNGLLAGGFSILIVVALYLIDPAMLFGYWAYCGIAGMIVIAIYASIQLKNANNGFIVYGESVLTSLIVFTIGQALYTVFLLILELVIDPSLVTKMKSLQSEKLDQLLDSGVINKEGYNAGLARIENINTGAIVLYSIIGLIIIAVISLIVFLISSIFIKKDSPFKTSSL